MFNLLKLSKTDWKNLSDAGWIFYGFLFFICMAGSLQQNDNWLVAFGWACAAFLLCFVVMAAAVLVWALPWIIWEFFEDRAIARRSRRDA